MPNIKDELPQMEITDVVAYFGSVSRQRMSQLIGLFEGTHTHTKLIEARDTLKSVKKKRKPRKLPTQEQLNNRKCMSLWQAVNKRCNSAAFHKTQPSYADCTVGFSCYEEFKVWALSQRNFNTPGFELDKDILVKGNTVYSPETCTFVPRRVNQLLVRCVRHRSITKKSTPVGVSYHKRSGKYCASVNVNGKGNCLGYFDTAEAAFCAYKAAKESEIRRVVQEYRESLDRKTYDALMAWEVASTD